uniref:SUV39H1 histone lysine methyltransferase a n=2 Tax=Cyprinus carpio TaxID=7962 RepID=A0A8C1B1S3_CYPCA
FQEDMKAALLQSNKPLDSESLSAPIVSLLLQKAKQRMKVQKWEDLMNQTCRHKGKGVDVNPVIVCCECDGCCPGLLKHRRTYNDSGQVKVMPIYECNSKCQCGTECANRVLQKGIHYDLCIFKTANGRGWGVLQRIYKNSFVMEYLEKVSKLKV